MSDLSLEPIMEGRRSQPHQLIEVLQDVQERYGYIPEEAMKVIAEELGVPIMEVYRVASFYKAFSLTPRGKNLLTICMGHCVSRAGGQTSSQPGAWSTRCLSGGNH